MYSRWMRTDAKTTKKSRGCGTEVRRERERERETVGETRKREKMERVGVSGR